MKVSKRFISLIAISAIILSTGCSKQESSDKNGSNDQIKSYIAENSADKISKESRTITTNSVEEFTDGKKISGNTEFVIDLVGDTKVIKQESSGDEGDHYLYYKLLDNGKVDVYHSNSKDTSFELNKDVNVKDTGVEAILESGSLDEKNSYKYEGEEEIDGKKVYKFSLMKKVDGVDLLTSSIDKSILEKNKELKSLIEKAKSGYPSYYWIDKDSKKVVKYEIDTSIDDQISYYVNEPEGKNPPLKKIITSTVDYNEKDIDIPSNVLK